MFRLIRLVISLATAIVVLYFAFTVPLGQKTLWEHIRAIASTDESQELVQGVKEKAVEVIDRGRDGGKTPLSGTPSSERSPKDDATAQEQERLRKIIRDRLEATD